jgi:plasmid stabilization system protein ParE
MESGYDIFWTDHALKELATAFDYLSKNFSEIEMRNLSVEIDIVIALIEKNPNMFQETEEKNGVRRTVILKFNTLYYRLNNNVVEILSFYSNRQKPKKIKF